MWPIVAHIEYRLALEAPGGWAAEVLGTPLARFMLGPPTEVVAATHTWEEVAPHIESPQDAAFVAQERVLRGEDLTGDDRAHPEVLQLPLLLQPWEPAYALATYRSDHVEVAEPVLRPPPMAPATAAPGAEVTDETLHEALLETVTPWTTQSNGAARAVVVEGGAAEAIAHLTVGAFRVAQVETWVAARALAWAAASGGAFGRRRGAAFGRSHLFYLGCLLAGLGWPCDAGELGRSLDALRWHLWDEGAPEEGWVLRVAVADPEAGWAAALAATDVGDDQE